MKVFLVDDHQMFRESIKTIFRTSFPDDEFILAGTVEEALEMLKKSPPDLLIADVGLGGADGIDLVYEVLKRCPGSKAMVLTMHSDIETVKRALRAGAAGYVTKGADIDSLVHGVETVVSGGFYFDQIILELMVNYLGQNQGGSLFETNLRSYGLTPREQDVFYLLREKGDLHEIAEELFISVKTVENHRSNIYGKLGVWDRQGLIEFYENKKQ